MNEHYDYICYNCRIKSNIPLSFLRPFNKDDIPFKYLDIHDNLSDIQELSKIFYNYIRKAEM